MFLSITIHLYKTKKFILNNKLLNIFTNIQINRPYNIIHLRKSKNKKSLNHHTIIVSFVAKKAIGAKNVLINLVLLISVHKLFALIAEHKDILLMNVKKNKKSLIASKRI